jgi:hypothetical protein
LIESGIRKGNKKNNKSALKTNTPMKNITKGNNKVIQLPKYNPDSDMITRRIVRIMS